jgi:hypothetical protein
MTNQTYAIKIGDQIIETIVDRGQCQNSAPRDTNAIKEFTNSGNLYQTIGTYLNVAQAFMDSGNHVSALACLRILDRLTNKSLSFIRDSTSKLSSSVASFKTPDDYKIVTYIDDIDVFYKEEAAISDYPGIYYGQFELHNNFDNLSFHVLRGSQLRLHCRAVVNSSGKVFWTTGSPIEFRFYGGMSDRTNLLKIGLRFLLWQGQCYGADLAYIKESEIGKFEIYGELKYNYLFSSDIWSRPVVDLNTDVAGLFSNVRRRYKPYINWGKKNIYIEYYSGERFNNQVKQYTLNLLDEMHADKISRHGQQMPRDQFDHTSHLISNGKGELSIGRDFNGQPVGVVVVLDEGQTTYYKEGGYRRDSKKSSSPFMIYDALLRARSRGQVSFVMNRFEPSPIYIHEDAKTVTIPDQELKQGLMKSGFSRDMQHEIVYSVRPRCLI